MGKASLMNKKRLPISLLLSNRKDVIYLKPRQEIELDKYEFDEQHINNMLKKGYITVRGGDMKSTEPSFTLSKPEAQKEKPKEKSKETEKTQSETKKSKH